MYSREQLGTEFAPELVELANIVAAAGEIVRASKISPDGVTDVAGKGLVTTADLSSDKYLQAEITKIYPGVPIVSEESGQAPEGQLNEAVIIDPIDGTRWFKDGGDMWTVTAAVVKGGELYQAVTYRPETDELWYGEMGKGSFSLTKNGRRKLKTSEDTGLEKVKVGVGANMSSLATREAMSGLLVELVERSRGPYVLASTALELAWVAQNVVLAADVHPHAKPWDTAAGKLLVTEAGGVATGLTGKKDIFVPGLIAAANLDLHRQLLDLVRLVDK